MAANHSAVADIPLSKITGIVGGPSREKMFDALRFRHERKVVVFTLTLEKEGGEKEIPRIPLVAQVDAIAIEDGSGNCWMAKLYVKSSRPGQSNITVFFNTKTRKGTMLEVQD